MSKASTQQEHTQRSEISGSAEPQVFVVLGMHKSGTTLLARMLHASGISMGQFGDDGDYDQGFFCERSETRKLNGQLLDDDDLESYDCWQLPDPREVGDAVLHAIREVVTKVEQSESVWGFKDPRTCLTYSIWRELLPPHKIVFVFRDPTEVCWHYVRRVPLWRPIRRLVRARAALRAWYIYNQQGLLHTWEAGPKGLSLSYRELMNSDESLDLLTRHAGRPIQDLRDPRMYRAKGLRGAIYNIARLWCQLVDGLHVEQLYEELQEHAHLQLARGGPATSRRTLPR